MVLGLRYLGSRSVNDQQELLRLRLRRWPESGRLRSPAGENRVYALSSRNEICQVSRKLDRAHSNHG
jgi:hypothetical protein